MRLRDRLYISTEIREGAKVPHALLHAHCCALLHAVVASTVNPVQLPVTRRAPCQHHIVIVPLCWPFPLPHPWHRRAGHQVQSRALPTLLCFICYRRGRAAWARTSSSGGP